MERFLLIFLCIVRAVVASESSDEFREVSAPVGKIRGSIITSRGGRDIYSFRGVRYALPPTGPRRFEVPVPVPDFDDVFDATKEGPGCPRLEGVGTSEDCLRLNVYSAKLPCKNEDVKRPVMVFFHPGAFYAFTAQSWLFGPNYLLDEDIVLVTVNYRLGTLGFISTGDALAPGNLGLKDQVMALRWVKRNIAAFGGDPDSITISGYSIGATSVLLHMLSPMSRNLFHRAIAMSASISPLELYPTEQKDLLEKQAELLGCPTGNTTSMIMCLKSKPADSFQDTMPQFFEWYGNPVMIWKPVVEPEVPGVERFLTDQPIELIRRRNFQQVPLIAGVTKDETSYLILRAELLARQGNDTMYRELDENWEKLAPLCLIYERDTPESRYASQELRRFYFKDQPISSATFDSLAQLFADGIVIYPVHAVAKFIARRSRQPVYFYEFTYQGRNTFLGWNETTPYGVMHHDDLQYLFYMPVIFPYLNGTMPEASMSEKYTAMWANFVQTGRPIPRNNDLFEGVTWQRFSPDRDNYLDINLNPIMKTGLFPHRMQMWERLFPLEPLTATKH